MTITALLLKLLLPEPFFHKKAMRHDSLRQAFNTQINERKNGCEDSRYTSFDTSDNGRNVIEREREKE